MYLTRSVVWGYIVKILYMTLAVSLNPSTHNSIVRLVNYLNTASIYYSPETSSPAAWHQVYFANPHYIPYLVTCLLYTSDAADE